MSIEIKAPTFPESVPDGTIDTWHKQPGEAVSRDELIVDIETDKVVLEVVAPADGMISEIRKAAGETVLSNEVIAIFTAGAAPAASEDSAPAETPASSSSGEVIAAPAARKLAAENNIDLSAVSGTGKDGRITKEDVSAFMKGGAQAAPAKATSAPAAKASSPAPAPVTSGEGDRVEKRVPMTRLRTRIADHFFNAKFSVTRTQTKITHTILNSS